jgi:hypothetical protein
MDFFSRNNKLTLKIVGNQASEKRYYLNETEYIKKIESNEEFNQWSNTINQGYTNLPNSIKSTMRVDIKKFEEESMHIAGIYEENKNPTLEDELKTTLSFKKYTIEEFIKEKEIGFALTAEQKEEVTQFLKKVENKSHYFHELTRFSSKERRGGLRIPILVGFLYYLTTQTKKYYLKELMSVTNKSNAKNYSRIFKNSIGSTLNYTNSIEINGKMENIELCFTHFKQFFKNNKITEYFNEFEIVTKEYWYRQKLIEKGEEGKKYLPLIKDQKNPNKYVFQNDFILEKIKNNEVIIYRLERDRQVILLSLKIEKTFDFESIETNEVESTTKDYLKMIISNTSIITLKTVFKEEIDVEALTICLKQALIMIKTTDSKKNISLIIPNKQFNMIKKPLNIKTMSEPITINGEAVVIGFLDLDTITQLTEVVKEEISKVA